MFRSSLRSQWNSFLNLVLFTILLNFVEVIYSDASVFNATSEWQVIGVNQSIPAGLHVRMDMVTGLREAKLMDDADQNASKSSGLLAVEPSNTGAAAHESSQPPSAESESFSKPPKSGRRAAHDQHLALDTESMDMLMQELSNSSLDWQRVPIVLDDLTSLLHQIEVGESFMRKYGLKTFKELMQSRADPDIHRLLLGAISAAVQGNANAKVAAYREGLPELLYSILRQEVDSAGVAQSALHCLGALLRRFPSAQRQFLDLQQTGDSGFRLLFEIISGSSSDGASHRSLALQVISLLSDFAFEKMDSKQEALDHPSDTYKQAEWEFYQRVPLEQGLTELKFCPQVIQIIFDVLDVSSLPPQATADHASNEMAVRSLLSLLPLCRGSVDCSGSPTENCSSVPITALRKRVVVFAGFYEKLALEEADAVDTEADFPADSYFTDMHKLFDSVVQQLDLYNGHDVNDL